MKERILNFSAGPAMLPLAVLERAQRDLVCLPGAGMSILEISHRSELFTSVLDHAEMGIRELLGIPDRFCVLFLPGGASLQFAMLPMNILGPEGRADYIDTGAWSKKAIAEARKIGTVRIAASTESGGYTRVPDPSELELDGGAAYVHYTSNETISGVQWASPPDVGGVPLVRDSSSDFLSRPIEVARHAIIYAGAQKNAGPAGVTIVIVRDDMLERTPSGLPVMLDLRAQATERSLVNTPPIFCIYFVGLVCDWLREQGGLEVMEERNREKADMLYRAIDESGGFYRGHACHGSRSMVNVSFRLPSKALEDAFVTAAAKEGLHGLAGHRSVGGLRASLYNALPREGVGALLDFMERFQQENG